MMGKTRSWFQHIGTTYALLSPAIFLLHSLLCTYVLMTLKNHDEIMEVLSGRAQFYIDGKKIIASAGDARLIIPRFSVHGIDFFKGEPTIIREKTVPAGEFKALFFQDVFRNGTPNFFMAMRAFYDGHSYAALPGNLKILDRLVST